MILSILLENRGISQKSVSLRNRCSVITESSSICTHPKLVLKICL